MSVDDLYPVRLFVGPSQLGRARIVTRGSVVRAFVDTGARVEVAREGELVGVTRVNGTEWELLVDEGDGVVEWTARRTGGCGCGSRLKRLDVDKAFA